MKKSGKEVQEKNKKKLSKKQIVIFSIIGVVLLSIIAGIIIYLKIQDSDPLNVKNPYDYLVFDESNNAYFNKVSETFEINVIPDKGFSYKIVDSEEKEVETLLEENKSYSVIKPKDKYKKGERYTLTITNGTFEHEDLKGVQKIEFKIVREQVENVVYNKDVIKVKGKSTTVNNNVLKTKEKYEVGDIILIDNKEAYKVTNINADGTYQVSLPELKEVYKELDIYIDAPIKITEFVPAKDIEEYVAYNVSQSKWYQSIIQTVNAAPKINVNLDTTGGKVTAKVEVEILAGESGFSLPLIKKHDLKFTLELEIEAHAYTDITWTHHDVQITLRMKDTLDFGINFVDEKFDEYAKKSIKDSTRIFETSKLLNTLTTDNGNVVTPLGGTVIPIGTTGLFLDIDFGMLLDYNMAVDAGYKNINERTTVFGYKWNAPFDLTLVGKVTSNSKEGQTYIGGKAEFKLGAEVNAGLNLLNLAEAKFIGNSGAYGDSQLTIGVGEYNNEPFYEINAKGEIGLFIDATVKAEVLKYAEAEWKFFEQKAPLGTFEKNETNKDEIVMKQEEDKKEESKEENKENENKEEPPKNDHNNKQENPPVQEEPKEETPSGPLVKFSSYDELETAYINALANNDLATARNMWVENNYPEHNYSQVHKLYNNRNIFYNGRFVMKSERSNQSFTGSYSMNTTKQVDYHFQVGELHISYRYCLNDKCPNTNLWDDSINTTIAVIQVDGYWFVLDDGLWENQYTTRFLNAGGDISQYRTKPVNK